MAGETFEIGRRTRNLPPPPWVVWESLTDPRRPGSGPWLLLRADESEPRILDSEKPRLVVWSSLWPQHPDEVIRFELASDGASGTDLTWTLTSPIELEPRIVGHQRFRLNKLLWEDLRYSYGN